MSENNRKNIQSSKEVYGRMKKHPSFGNFGTLTIPIW